MQVRDLVFVKEMSRGLGYFRELCSLINVHVPPEDGQHQWPKHVVVPNVVNT